ncbi:MAG TPA: sugar-binding protein [Gemmatimonadales bacterium]|nr:sugar-binding protein [Gemmatimonadales bacterium]
MVTAETLAARRETIAGSSDLTRLLARLGERAAPVLKRLPPIPSAKALLSVDGGVCPDDGTTLRFDPWSPTAHECPRCGKSYGGERHERWWARFQHLWVAERAAHLAALAAFAGHDAAGARARELLGHYGTHYFEYPNRDNVLGPSRLFFSTYLESIWLTHYLAAAMMLRESGCLDRATADGVARVADEAATLIGEFDEGFSNRQTWHSTALAAIAVWFEDEELLRRAVEGPTGLISHLLQGFGRDGMWFEGENYHLFALRGLLLGLDWVRSAGVDPLEEPELATRARAALEAPALTALPDLTFPARKDSRFGTSLAQPMYLELWEAGRGSAPGTAPDELDDWLAGLYDAPAPAAESFDSYLHEAGEPPPTRRSRADLSWWMLLAMAPTFQGDATRWRPGSTFLESQGLAILRTGGRYASLEAGAYGGGHGHPDRLHLTLHERGVHWLADFGAGSYVSRDLFWYRSTLAHNAPRLDRASQEPGDAVCEFFDAKSGWSWVRGRFGPVSRTLVSGPDYLLDVVELDSEVDHRIDLPWHLAGRLDLRSAGAWQADSLAGELVTDAERQPIGPGDQVRVVASQSGQTLALVSRGATELLRATAPGPPGAGPTPFVVLAGEGRGPRFVSVLAPSPLSLEVDGDAIAVTTGATIHRHQPIPDGWEVALSPADLVRLGGRRALPRVFEPLVTREPPLRQSGVALHLSAVPPLNGTVEGFDRDEALALDHEDQYRRSEEPYSGPDDFSAVAFVNWDDDALYLAVDVTKPEIVLRAGDAPPLLLDNEPDDIHSDGVEIFLRVEPDAKPYGFLVVPDPDGRSLRTRAVQGFAGEPAMVTGAWTATDSGYVVSLALRVPEWGTRQASDRVGFDLLVNEMLSDRERRAGQLVWSGGGGWVWLKGDRQDPERFGELELA